MYSKSVLLVLGCVVVGVFTAPADVPPEKLQPTVIPIVSQSDELEPNGTYKFSYETGNGITREETAYEKILPETGKARGHSSSEEGEDDGSGSNEIHVQRGSYSYTAPDGTIISVRYIADENGFQPIGDHIPRSLVTVPGSKSAEKSGRALKIADNSEASSVPVKANVAGKPAESAAKGIKQEATSATAAGVAQSVSAPTLFAKEDTPVSAPTQSTKEAQTKSVSVPKENKFESISASTTVPNEDVSTPAVPIQETKPETEASTTEKNSEDISPTESAQTTTEVALAAKDSSPTTISGSTTANVDVSTEAASTAASTQSSTETEQTSTASAESASTSSPEQTTSVEVSEQSSSTSAAEPTSSSEVVGPSTSTETVNQSTTEEAGQPSTNAPKVASSEEPSTTSVAA